MRRLRYYVAARVRGQDRTGFLGLDQEGDFTLVEQRLAVRFPSYKEACRFVDCVFRNWLRFDDGDRYMIFSEQDFEMSAEDWDRIEREYGDGQ